MKLAALSFAASAATAFVVTPLVRDLALRRGWLDPVAPRKQHRRPVPRVGGVAIVVAFFLPLLVLALSSSAALERFGTSPGRALGLLLGGLLVAGLGVYDDLRGARPRVKLLVQLAAAALAYALGFRIDAVESPFGGVVQLGWLGLPFTMLWIAGVINALNLIDGLDGLAGGVAFIAVGTLGVVAAAHDAPLMLLFTATLAGAVLGFLPRNVNPASVFMGDTGSMFLGFVIATTAIRVNQTASATVALATPIVALGVPIADTLLAMVRRAFRGAPIFSADRSHLHHRLLALGLSHRQAVGVLWGASAVLAAAALALHHLPTTPAALVVGGLVIAALLSLHRLGYLRPVDPGEVLGQRRRNLQRREGIRRVGELLQQAGTEAELWAAARLARRVLGACTVSLRVVGPGGRLADFAHGAGAASGAPLLARFPLPGGEEEEALELAWDDGRDELDRDTEIAVECFCDHLAGATERLRRGATRRLRSLRIA